MKTFVYTIYDSIAKECGPIFQAKNLGVATRYVEDLVKESLIKPSDYDLYCLGEFNTESAFLDVFPKADVVSFDTLLSTFSSEEVKE